MPEVRFNPHELRRTMERALAESPLASSEYGERHAHYLRRLVLRAMMIGAELFAEVAAREADRLEIGQVSQDDLPDLDKITETMEEYSTGHKQVVENTLLFAIGRLGGGDHTKTVTIQEAIDSLKEELDKDELVRIGPLVSHVAKEHEKDFEGIAYEDDVAAFIKSALDEMRREALLAP